MFSRECKPRPRVATLWWPRECTTRSGAIKRTDCHIQTVEPEYPLIHAPRVSSDAVAVRTDGISVRTDGISVLAVGKSGTALRANAEEAGKWAIDDTKSTADLYGCAASGKTAYAVGTGGTVLRYSE